MIFRALVVMQRREKETNETSWFITFVRLLFYAFIIRKPISNKHYAISLDSLQSPLKTEAEKLLYAFFITELRFFLYLFWDGQKVREKYIFIAK